VGETWLPRNKKNQILPPFGKNENPHTEKIMEERKVREALIIGHFREEKIASVLEISTTLKRIKMNSTTFFFFLFKPSSDVLD
jgi:hypothetical protein